MLVMIWKTADVCVSAFVCCHSCLKAEVGKRGGKETCLVCSNQCCATSLNYNQILLQKWEKYKTDTFIYSKKRGKDWGWKCLIWYELVDFWLTCGFHWRFSQHTINTTQDFNILAFQFAQAFVKNDEHTENNTLVLSVSAIKTAHIQFQVHHQPAAWQSHLLCFGTTWLFQQSSPSQEPEIIAQLPPTRLVCSVKKWYCSTAALTLV